MILKCLASDYYATASAEVHRQRLSIDAPNGDSNLKSILSQDRSSEQIPPGPLRDRLLQCQPPFVATSHKHLKPTKEVSDSLLKLLVPHPLPYARNDASTKGVLPTRTPRYSRAQQSAFLEVPSVSDETNQPLHTTEKLFHCSLGAGRSCGPRINRPRDILEAVGLSLEPASTAPSQQSLDPVTFLSEVEEKLEVSQYRYQEIQIPQFLDEKCSQSTKVAVSLDTSPAVIYQASLSLSPLRPVEVPHQTLPNVAVLDFMALRSEQGVSRTQDLPSVATTLFGDDHIQREKERPCIEVPIFSDWEHHLNVGRLSSWNKLWYHLTSKKAESDKLPGVPSSSFQTLIVARELSLGNYIMFLPVPEVAETESEAEKTERSTFTDLGTSNSQRSSYSSSNLEWHLSGTVCGFESCHALLRQTAMEQQLVLEYPASSSRPVSGIMQLTGDECSARAPGVLHIARHVKEERMKEKLQPTIVERIDSDVHEVQAQQQQAQQQQEYNFIILQHQQVPIVRVTHVDHQPDDLGAFIRARVKSVVTAQQKQTQSVPSELETEQQQQSLSAPVVPPLVSPTEFSVNVNPLIKNVLVAAGRDYQKLSVQAATTAEWEGPDFSLDPFGTEDIQRNIQDLVLHFRKSKQTELRRLIGLYVLRQTAYNCFHYGLRVAHLYLETQEQSENLEFLKPLTCSVKSCLEAGYAAVKEGGEDHPKIPLLLSLLKEFCSAEACCTDSQGSGVRKKILIVAERRTFFTMYWQLVELGLSPYQFDREEVHMDQGQVDISRLVTMLQKVNEAHCFTDCLLLPPQYLVEGFPLQSFSLAVLYSSLHVQKLQQCGVTQYVFQMASPGNLVPPASEMMTLSSSPDCTIVMQPNDQPKATSDFKKQVDTPKPDVMREKVVVVENVRDTQCSLSWPRRSLQQHLLNVEKHGVEVMEREMHLPVDLVLSPSTCLFLYTLEKLNVEKATLFRRPAEVLSAAVETIIDDHMRASSVAFHRCVMVFEGPPPFIDGIQAVLDDIYCAGIALDMYTECFLSTHSTTTQSIVERQIRLCGCQLQAAQETETVAEVFLSSFPSFNPLSALAVLSCGIPLPVFLCLSLDQQDKELQKFGVGQDRTRLAYLQMNADQSEGIRQSHEGRPFPEEQTAAPSAMPLRNTWEPPSTSAERLPPSHDNFVREESADAGLREFQQMSHRRGSVRSDRKVPATSTTNYYQDTPYTAGNATTATPHIDRGWEGERSIPASRPPRAPETFTTFAPEAMNSSRAANLGRRRTYPPPTRSQGGNMEEGMSGGRSRTIHRGGSQNGDRLWRSRHEEDPLLPPMTRSGFGYVAAEELSVPMFPSAAEIMGDAQSSESPPPDFPPVSCFDDSGREQSPLDKFAEASPEGPEYVDVHRKRMRPSRQHESAAGSVRGTLDRWLSERRMEEPKQAERRAKGMSQIPAGRKSAAPMAGERLPESPILFSPLRPKQKVPVLDEDFGADDGMEESWKKQGPKWSLEQIGHNRKPSFKAGQKRVFGPPPGASSGKRKRGVSADMFDTFTHNTPAKSAACSFWDQSPQAAPGPVIKEKLTAWTPVDKRSKEVLSFERSGPKSNKQSKLVWRKTGGGKKGGPGYDASYTM